jgi:hypothetical protein
MGSIWNNPTNGKKIPRWWTQMGTHYSQEMVQHAKISGVQFMVISRIFFITLLG